jgi:PhzF family phenazine biosynthesis protein
VHFALDQWQVDAFSDKAFGGNPAAVVLVQRDDQWMQNVAMENNLAETSFLEKLASNRYKLRW